MRSNSVFELVEEGDVLVSTVGPFTKWGEPAVRAAITGHAAAYIDSTGEPAFIRRVFQNHGPIAKQAGVPLLTAMGYDFVPGALAGALALEEAGEDAVRVDVGYYALGMTTQSGSTGTRASLVGASLDESHAFRDGALRTVRTAERVRSFPVKDKERAAVSVGGAEHLALPGAPDELEVGCVLDRGAHRLPHAPRGAGDSDPRHAASGSAAGQTPATASVKAASSGPMPAAESASGIHSSSTSPRRSSSVTASMRAMISSISSSGSP